MTLLGLQVKILFAGWRKDGTWPDSATVVDDDNFFGPIESQASDTSVIQMTPLDMPGTSSLVGRKD
jgi:hypothetical protein